MHLNALRTLYDIGLKEAMKSDVMVSIHIPKTYTLESLKEQIAHDHANTSTTVKQVLRRLNREFILWTHHIKRKA
ncbi:MAG: Unknown protein [uncultured Sulfurovum sp.]|uniref:Uncharacterized protein n=1 Tax=uncultured Sulfurovum sp. TaxID=269237 RepID=A0A6S6SBW3_9BACT|nr:MAG: Unknown protein [uncultured Sulfurovum sp.]